MCDCVQLAQSIHMEYNMQRGGGGGGLKNTEIRCEIRLCFLGALLYHALYGRTVIDMTTIDRSK